MGVLKQCPWVVGLALLPMLLLSPAAEAAQIRSGKRSLLARPFVKGKRCENTVAGRWLSTDDRGLVCPLQDVDSQTGCCKKGDQYSCETCLLEDKCCVEYEHCVSCCMRKDHTMDEDVQNTFRVGDRPETGHWSTVFELCRAKCRTTPHITVHENSYVGRRHHCFGQRRKPLLEPQADPLPAGLTAVPAASANQNCHQVCASKHLTCAEQHFDEINHCDRLRDHFGCEAGCQPDTSTNKGPDHPAYVIYQSSKETLPTMCLTSSASGISKCLAKHPKTRRLCPCV